MTEHLCDILAKEIAASGLVTLSGGLATVWKSNDREKGHKAASWDFENKRHVLLAPDEEQAAITYFEERSTAIGASPVSRYRADLTLIGWVNTNRGIVTPVLIEQLQQLFKRPLNRGMFTGVKVDFVELLPESEQLFARYSYDSAVRRYLQKPYDAFGLRCYVSYNVNPQC